MNRRGFISLIAGAAGASLVPWRADARAALADDLLHDWSRDQPSGERIWS